MANNNNNQNYTLTENENKEGKSVGGVWIPPIPSVPVDKEGYIQAFAVTDSKGIQNFFNKYGFVIVENVFSAEECEETLKDIWEYIEDRTYVVKGDVKTWESSFWNRTGIPSEGMIGGASIFSKRSLINRQNPNLYNVFATVLGSKDILCNQDRYGLFKPTKNVKECGGKDRPDWKTHTNLHLDMNPWSFLEDKDLSYDNAILGSLNYKSSSHWIIENNQVGIHDPKFFKLNVQGLVNLIDNKEDDGGFQLVPGFVHHFKEWTEKNQSYRKKFGIRSTFNVIPESDLLYKHAIRATMRQGSCIVWDQRTVHGSKCNNSNNWRAAQFFKFFYSIDPQSERAKKRRQALYRHFQDTRFTPSEHGQKVFGLLE